jgi:branched-chain amino acid transport system substrate-binding protein
MRFKGHKPGLAAAAIVAALAFSACGQDADGGGGSDGGSGGGGGASETSPIKIGVLLELTGPGSDYGTRGKDMIEMLVDEYGGKIGDRPIEVVFADTATNPATAVAKARQLITRDKVDVTYGPVFSDAQDAITPYLAQQKVLALAPIGANWGVAKHKNWLVFPGTLDSFCLPGGKALKDAGHDTLATLAADYVAGHQMVDPVGKEFQDAGGKWAQKQYAPLGTSDFGSYMSSLKDVDAVASWTIMPDQLSYLKAFTKFKGKSDTELFLCEAENVTAEQLKETGPGIIGTRGMIASYSPDLENPANEKYKAAVQERYDRVPVIGDGTNYLLFKTLLEGLKKTNGDASLDVLRPAILELKQDTIAGPVAWTKNGMALTNRYLATVAEGEGGRYIWKVDETFENVRDPRDTE